MTGKIFLIFLIFVTITVICSTFPLTVVKVGVALQVCAKHLLIVFENKMDLNIIYCMLLCGKVKLKNHFKENGCNQKKKAEMRKLNLSPVAAAYHLTQQKSTVYISYFKKDLN